MNVTDLTTGTTLSLEDALKRSLPKGGDGGNNGDMEARVKRLEDDMKEIKGDLKSLLKDSAEIKGKISNMPSTWQMIGICGVMIGLVLASCGFAFTLAKFLQT
jgi:hypothetical protein